MKNNKITSRDIDFAKWYTDVVYAARLADYSNTKGCIVYEPNGYAIWEMMQSALDKMFKETGHRNVYMPLLIPENLMKKEKDLIEGFAPEAAWVTIGGSKELDERLCIRPTSETLFSDYYSRVLKSYRDLPMKYNQWCSVMRWEKETRPFLRGREFLWQEGHTIHETAKEAEEETNMMLGIYKKFFEEYLAIPVVTGLKTEKEKFSGAEYTLTVESLMYNGMALQSATSHYFGQKFSKAYNIKFLGRDSKEEYAYQTSWGISTRAIGALIMVHGDDNGLVLPPNIAPRQAVIIPISNNEQVVNLANEYCNKLNQNNITAYIDNTDKTPGFKFAEAEVNGIPIRLEIGERDIINNNITIVRRDTREKLLVNINEDIVTYVKNLMKKMQQDMFDRALKRQNELSYECHDVNEIKNIISTKPGFITAMWCGDEKCEAAMKEINGIKSRCILENHEHIDDKCIICGKPASKVVVWGIQY